MSLPLLRAFPALASIPRAELGAFPSPVHRVTGLPGDTTLWLKRDDLDAPVAAGNKVRALEFLLAESGRGDTVLTVGGEGSTHVLATASHAARLGARTIAVRWPHDMTPGALEVAELSASLCSRVIRARTIVDAMLIARVYRLMHRVRWVPFGGASPLGILGHVNAALELAEQIAVGMLPAPARIVVPLGTGGTAAGLALGVALAGLPSTVVAARCGPRIGSNRRRVLKLAAATRALLRKRAGVTMPSVDPSRIEVVHDAFGGAYGRAHPDAERAARALDARTGVKLDSTYGAKALLIALAAGARDGEPTLLWITFSRTVTP
jgi:D-cysteine desulfhydrase